MKNNRFVTINSKRFHYIWLRDNCLCPKCRHSSSFQKVYDYTEHSSPPEPLSVVERDGELKITWKEEPQHESIFPIDWLLSYAYDPQPETHWEKETILWDKSWLDGHPPRHYDIHSCPESTWIEQLFSLGFTILENIAPEELEPFLTSIGPIFETEYGKMSDMKPTPDAKDIGYAAQGPALPPHTDHSYKLVKNLAECFYCVEHNAIGGESLILDGFYVAQEFRRHHPDYFQILAQTPVPFSHFDPEYRYFFSQKIPIIELDRQGEVSHLCFAHKNCYRDVPFEETESFYEAYSAFMSYLKNLDYQYRFRLKPGDCLIVWNSRILHGRTAYDANAGTRHLKLLFIDWDYFVARQNFARVKHLYKD